MVCLNYYFDGLEYRIIWNRVLVSKFLGCFVVMFVKELVFFRVKG